MAWVLLLEAAGANCRWSAVGRSAERGLGAPRFFRRTAENVKIEIDGVEAYDVEPRVLPNLYYGSPLRLYGREIERKAKLEFPERDDANPEIERLWAWHAVERLKRQLPASGDSPRITQEIVGLGEDYSIVTEYTSFLVLENDREYRRWKIDRKNLRRLDRDRAARRELTARLEAIRDRSTTGLGPEGVTLAQRDATAPARATPIEVSQSPARPSRPTRRPHSERPKRRARGVDFNFGGGGGGGGPVGPVFVGLSLWLARRKRRGAKAD